MVPLTATGPEVYVFTMTTFLSKYYDAFEETLNNLSSIKLNIYPGDNVTDCCSKILVDAKCLYISGYFKPDHLSYINCIFGYASDSILCL